MPEAVHPVGDDFRDLGAAVELPFAHSPGAVDEQRFHQSAGGGGDVGVFF